MESVIDKTAHFAFGFAKKQLNECSRSLSSKLNAAGYVLGAGWTESSGRSARAAWPSLRLPRPLLVAETDTTKETTAASDLR
jgi:hypothetical protein